MCYELTEKLLKSKETKAEEKKEDGKELEAVFAAEKLKKPPVDVKDMVHFAGTVRLS